MEVPVKLRLNLTVVLALIVAALAVFQFSNAGSRFGNVSPALLILVAALLGARYAVKRQKEKRAELLKAVPRRPLGISDDSSE